MILCQQQYETGIVQSRFCQEHFHSVNSANTGHQQRETPVQSEYDKSMHD